MNIDITHKHAGHLIVIEGQAFKANNAGQWNLTEIWRTLKLPQGKAPAQWRTKQAKRMEAMQNLHSSNGSGSWATKRATLGYAGWVSVEFEEMVFDAFEAVLERPEVAQVVAEVMTDLGRSHSATILKRMTFNDKCDWKALKRGPQSQTPAAKAYRHRKAQEAKLAALGRRNTNREGC
ncbi:hypothetical protein N8H22_04940 [Stutzerimonas stutzeri]|uniref:hypothetical protein n=1 Tax=Stutzerimonas sp. S1 TaxID=3030652 RepID=UPI0022253749|nr:hypothetical protein [Stutzerimonas sp. S1]MCW3147954.1 hypothetical protein [Stutzerimonas sp. S1]